MPHFEQSRGELLVSCDPGRQDLDAVHAFVSRSYWAEGIPRELLARALANSLCFGLFEGGRQIGFARVVSDRATFAYLADVYVLEEWRGRGLATWLMECVLAHPDLQGLRRWALVTRDAHALYRKFGFVTPPSPERWMEISRPGLYRSGA